MARVAVRVSLWVILVFGLGLPEIAGGRELGSRCLSPATAQMRRHRQWSLLPQVFAPGWCRKSPSGSSTSVVTLAVECRWVVNLKEELQQPSVTDTCRIEGDFYRFGMRTVIAICGIGNIAASASQHGSKSPRHSDGSDPARPRSSLRQRTARSCVMGASSIWLT